MIFEAINLFSEKSYQQCSKHDRVFGKWQHELAGSQLCSTCCNCGLYLYPAKEMGNDMND